MSQSPPVYILGGSQTDFARNWQREGLSIYDMFAETLREAVSNAEIEPSQIEVGLSYTDLIRRDLLTTSDTPVLLLGTTVCGRRYGDMYTLC